MALHRCTLSTSKPKSSVERLSFIRFRTSSVTRFSSFDILFVIVFRCFPVIFTTSCEFRFSSFQFLFSVRRHPSVQRNRRSRKPRRFLRRQEHRHLRNVRGLPDASERNRRNPRLQPCLAALTLIKYALH